MAVPTPPGRSTLRLPLPSQQPALPQGLNKPRTQSCHRPEPISARRLAQAQLPQHPNPTVPETHPSSPAAGPEGSCEGRLEEAGLLRQDQSMLVVFLAFP